MTEAGMSEKDVMKRKAAMKERKSVSKVLCPMSREINF